LGSARNASDMLYGFISTYMPGKERGIQKIVDDHAARYNYGINGEIALEHTFDYLDHPGHPNLMDVISIAWAVSQAVSVFAI